MEHDLMNALAAFFQWPSPLFLILGTLLGALFGILPGLGGAQVVALLTPLTYGMEPRLAIAMIVGAMGAVPFGGSIPAILINTPGTGVSSATLLDGFPLTRQGKAGVALGASATSSCLGGIFGALVLLILIPIGQQVVMAFSFPEMFWMAAIGVSIIIVVSQGAMWKGIIVGGLGLMLSAVGFDPINSSIRFTFGITYLWDGIKIVPAVIGLFAIPEAIELFTKGGSVARGKVETSMSDVWLGIKSIFKNFGLFLRCSVIGTIIGIIPGVGGGVACWVAYGHAVQSAKDKSKFGKGDVRGVVAPEAAVCAKDGGALVPTVAFGIPGSVEMAVLLGTLMILGITPGPRLIIEHVDVVYTMIFALIASNVIISLLGIFFGRYLARITTIPTKILSPIIFVFCLLGAYATSGLFPDVILALVFGILGYTMKVFDFSRIPLVISLVLGRLLQSSFQQTLQSKGWLGFINRPIALALCIATLIILIMPLWKSYRQKGKGVVAG